MTKRPSWEQREPHVLDEVIMRENEKAVQESYAEQTEEVSAEVQAEAVHVLEEERVA